MTPYSESKKPEPDRECIPFVALSRSLVARGDLSHAERILKGAISYADDQPASARQALGDIYRELATIYETQGRVREAEQIRTRLQSA